MAPKANKAAAKKEEPAKRKADEPEKQPAAKEAKKDETPAAVAEAKPEEPKEPEFVEETDDSKKGNLKEAAAFSNSETTLNVVQTMGGKVLATMSEGGMQYLIAGARANTGMKAGRYIFEVKMLEGLGGGNNDWNRQAPGPKPRQLVRIGFSTSTSSLVLSDGEEQVFFDSEGAFVADKKKSVNGMKRFGKDQTIAVLLNLDPKSPNKNTLSLFKDGERLTKPQALPEHLVGKVLYPHVSFRNVTLQVNLGPEPLKALPFKIRSIGNATLTDVKQTVEALPKDGKHEVVFPVCYPDEGTFEWLDEWMKANPGYVELSDRKILEWAQTSGLWSKGGWKKSSNDKPEFNFGVQGMDDFSIRRVVNAIAPVVPRNYVVMEVKGNLVEADRKHTMQRFNAKHYRKVAKVAMGEPPKAFKEMQHQKMLKQKQDKSDAAWKAAQIEKKRKKDNEKRAKQFAEMKKKAEEAKKKREEEIKKKAEEAKKKKEEEAAKKKAEAEKKDDDKKDGEEKKEEEKKDEPMEEKKEEKEEEKKEEEKKDEPMEEKKEEPEEEEEEETEPPKVELTDEEKKQFFATPTSFDMAPHVFANNFADFSIPTEGEGFDKVDFEWMKSAAAKEYLRRKLLEKKKTERMENLRPSAWFTEKLTEWNKTFDAWKKKQEEFKTSPEQKAKEEAAKKKAAEKKDGDAEEEKDEEEGDIFSVEDVTNVGGEPLFKNFAFEDWALLKLRYELFLLQAAYTHDVNDEDRPGVTETHFDFYFNKYFRKNLVVKAYGVESMADLMKLVKDTVVIDGEVLKQASTLKLTADDDVSHFIKLAEENRRERQRRIDAGDETARLKIQTSVMNPPMNKDGGYRGGKVGGGWRGGGKGGNPGKGGNWRK